MAELTTDTQITHVLRSVRTIAVIGAHFEPQRPAFYVPDYLHAQGYEVFPVNATLVGKTLWGQPVRASLSELPTPIDLVDVFRRSEQVPMHQREILAMRPLPRVVWLQLGIRNDAVASALIAAGIDVVQDRCTLADHRRLGIGPAQP